jgi:cob(I)alamin adenosyltransferase
MRQPNDEEYPTMAKGTVELVLGDAERELSQVCAIVTRAIQVKTPLFLGRFLSDIAMHEKELSSWTDPHIVVRQFGCSCYVNACPPLADANRVEIGLEEAEAALRSNRYEVVLLSQILTAIDEDLLTTQDIESLFGARPQHVTLILTGRNAPSELTARYEGSHQGSQR